jgi:hypothetical protein
MIVSASECLRVGDVIPGLQLKGAFIRQPLLVVREATREEWYQWGRENNDDAWPLAANAKFFYEVSTD